MHIQFGLTFASHNISRCVASNITIIEQIMGWSRVFLNLLVSEFGCRCLCVSDFALHLFYIASHDVKNFLLLADHPLHLLEITIDIIDLLLIVSSSSFYLPVLVFHCQLLLDQCHLTIEEQFVVLAIVDEIVSHAGHCLKLRLGGIGLRVGGIVVAK